MTSVALSSITDAYIGNDGFSKGEITEAIMQQTIYGRTNETLTLLKTYQKLLQSNKAQTVFVHGESGTGKTALVDILRDQACSGAMPGYFVTGKYFQNSGGVQQEAHSAIMAAFSDLCDLVAQSDDFDRKRQDQIKTDLGSDALLLVKSVSNLAPFTDAAFKEMAVDAAVMKSKFKSACKTFLRAMSSDEHPIVLFLDDVQWADEGSRQLMEVFLQDSELQNVMFVLAYRDEEATEVEDILVHARSPIDIQLSNLDEGAVYQIVSSVTGSSSDDTRALSDLVAKRTVGNPFHVMVFLETIRREGLLVFAQSDGHTSLCNFDVDKIQATVMASESLAGLLTRKMDRLRSDITEILKVASMVGYSFDETVLVAVTSKIIRTKSSSAYVSVKSSLNDGIKEGFIEQTSSGYQFTHDRLQAAFQSLIDEEEENNLHLLIGRAFLTSYKKDRSKMYNAAVHLNNAPGFLYSVSQRSVLARINLEAATYCENKSAFNQAVEMLHIGLDVMGLRGERWAQRNFDLTLEMMESLARMQLIVGDFAGCKRTIREGLCNCKKVEIKIRLLLIDVEVRMAGNELQYSTCYRALSILGVAMPQKVKPWHVGRKLLKVRRMLSRKTDEEVLKLVIIDDSLFNNTIKLLMHVCCHSFVMDDVPSGVYAALLAAELTLESGLATYSPAAFAIYGLAEVRNVDQAYRYGKLALAILDILPCKEAECYTVTFAMLALLSLKEPLSKMIDPLRRAAKSGYQRGDLLHASYASAQSLFIHNYLGTHLVAVEASMRDKYNMVSDLGQDDLLLCFQPALQYVINMQRDRLTLEDLSILSGEIMNEETYFRQQTHPFHTVIGLLMKAELASYFDQFKLAAALYVQLEALEAYVKTYYIAPFYYCNAARTQFSLYALSGRRQHLRKGFSLRKSLQRMRLNGCRNATPLIALLDAEKLALKQTDEDRLQAVYDRGIKCLARHQLLPFEGMLNEKAGFDFARRGWYAGAEQYFRRALHIYKHKWGATAKYNRLLAMGDKALAGMTKVAVPNPYGTCITVNLAMAR